MNPTTLDAREKELRAKVDASPLDADHKRRCHCSITTLMEMERSHRRSERTFRILIAILVAWIAAEIWLF